MKGAAGKGGLLEREARGSQGHQGGGGPLGMLPAYEARRRSARGRKQPTGPCVARPSPQRHPACRGSRAHDRERTDSRACRRFGRAHQRPERQGQSHRRGGVQAPRQKLARYHDHACAASLALEATYPYAPQLRRSLGAGGTAHLALSRTVAVNDQVCAVRPARRATYATARRPRFRGRRHLRSPCLDVERASANPLWAPLLSQGCRSTTRRMVHSKIPFASPFLSGRHLAITPPPGSSPTRSSPGGPLRCGDPYRRCRRSRPSTSLRELGLGSINQCSR